MYKPQFFAILSLTFFFLSCAGDNESSDGVDAGTSTDVVQAEDTGANTGVGADAQAEDVTLTETLSPLGGACEVNEDCAAIGPAGDKTKVCLNNQLVGGLGLDVEAEIPNGYCSDMTCNSASDCGEGEVQCIDLKASGENIPFNVCVLGCTEGAGGCFADQQCFCDPDQEIFNTEGAADFCSCLPDALIELIAGD